MDNPTTIIKKIKRLEIFTSRNTTEAFTGNFKSSFRGQGLEIDDLRPYDDGDDVRSIDWITSAKQGSAYVKKYKETRETSVLVMVDLSASMNFGSGENRKKDVALELAATLFFSALKNGDKFGALLFGKSLKYIPPKKGQSQFFRILRETIMGYENNSGVKADLNEALRFLNKAVKRRVVCILLSDELSLEASASLGIANKKHDFVFINIFDKFERGEFGGEILKMIDPETGEEALVDFSRNEFRDNFKNILAEKLEREKEIMRKNKIDGASLSTEDNIHDQLSLFFKRKQRR